MARLIPGQNTRVSAPIGGAKASPAHDKAAQAGVVRYDATVRELVRAAPAAAGLLARLGCDVQRDSAMTLAEAAERAGWPREALIVMAAQALRGSCTGSCDVCDHSRDEATTTPRACGGPALATGGDAAGGEAVGVKAADMEAADMEAGR